MAENVPANTPTQPILNPLNPINTFLLSSNDVKMVVMVAGYSRRSGIKSPYNLILVPMIDITHILDNV